MNASRLGRIRDWALRPPKDTTILDLLEHIDAQAMRIKRLLAERDKCIATLNGQR